MEYSGPEKLERFAQVGLKKKKNPLWIDTELQLLLINKTLLKMFLFCPLVKDLLQIWYWHQFSYINKASEEVPFTEVYLNESVATEINL